MPSAKNTGPMDRLKAETGGLASALAERAMSSVRDKVESTTGRLTDYVEGEAGPGLMAAVTGAKRAAEGKSPAQSMLSAGLSGLREGVSDVFHGGKGKGGSQQKPKLTNIVESIEVGVPIRLAYNQWTQYRDFPAFTKKVENAESADDTRVNWKAQVFWSHRAWEATIIDQRPDERIIWRSRGEKGSVDGAVTFHELTPTLTRIVVVLEYHPQGLFERTGNLWRAQGRRVRLELKHFQRHVTVHALLSPDDIEGWRGVIEDGEVVKDHETVLNEEGREQGDDPAETADDDAADAVAEEPAHETESGDDERPDEDADGERSGSRRRAPARGGSRGRAPARTRQGATRGGGS
jgi:uncharacterized membrane protein